MEENQSQNKNLPAFSSSIYKMSVIIPVYNNGKYLLNRCIKSLRNSSLFNEIEIIIIDDGSEDQETIEIVKNIKKKYNNVITYFFSKGGSGSASRPRNKGIELSTTPFIAFLDPDNQAINNGLAILYNELFKDPTLEMVIGNYIKKSNNNSIVFDYYNKVLRNCNTNLIMDGKKYLKMSKLSSHSIQAVLVRKKIIIRNKLKMIEKALGEDTLFFQELLIHSKKTKVVNTDIKIYYSNVEGSVTNDISNSFFEKYYILEKRRIFFLRNNGLLRSYMLYKYNYYFTNWYLKHLLKVSNENLEASMQILYKIYLLYKPYLINRSSTLKSFEEYYLKKEYTQLINIIEDAIK
ncbi:glycosyltransferase family 2 protein [Rossellomorea sp. NPDC077527]|uniref:glycosyltransferase family 2 protein n=1 Tax=Rossellomorea sp. NPDC077527 TaxID=3364510 RepID=UPI0037C6FF09